MPACDDRPRALHARAAALELDGIAAGFLDEALGGGDRLLVRRLVGAEGQIADQQGRAQSAPHRGGQHQHLVDRHRDRRRVAEHRHRAGVADEHDVDAGLLGHLRRRVVVGRDHHDRLAEALLLGQARQRHRHRAVEALGDRGVGGRRHGFRLLLGGWRPVGGRHRGVGAARGPSHDGYRHVVDQAHRADARGHGHEDVALDRPSPAPSCPPPRWPGTRARCGHRPAGRSRPPWPPPDRARRAATAAWTARSARYSAAACSRSASEQQHVAARQREAVGGAHGGADLDPHREVEVADEPAHDRCLLGVLLAEVGDVRSHHVEQLAHHRGHAVEMPVAAVRALQALGEPAHRHRGGKPVGIDLAPPEGRRGSRRPGSAARPASRSSSRG